MPPFRSIRAAHAAILLALLLSACAGSTRAPAIPRDENAPTATQVPTSAAFYTHIVEEGDTCEFIAFSYSASVEELINLNGLAPDCSDLFVGQSLLVPRPGAGGPEAGVTRLPLARAEELVRAHIFASQPGMNPAAVFPLSEITTDTVWDTLGAQVYKVTGETLLNQSFVVRGEQVTPIGQSFGGSGVHSLLVADLDGTSPPELVYAYDFGSGIHQSGVGVYRVEPNGVRAYELADFRFQGTVSLALRADEVVVSGRPDAGGVLSDWRELGSLRWIEGRPVLVAP